MQTTEWPLVVHVSVPAVPEPVLEKATVPVGATAVPGLVSVTVALHVVATPTGTMAGVQAIAVEVVRWVTVSVSPLGPQGVDTGLLFESPE